MGIGYQQLANNTKSVFADDQFEATLSLQKNISRWAICQLQMPSAN